MESITIHGLHCMVFYSINIKLLSDDSRGKELLVLDISNVCCTINYESVSIKSSSSSFGEAINHSFDARVPPKD